MLVGIECVVKPDVTFVCNTGTLEVDKCVIRPVPITRCDKGTLDGDVCVIRPVVVTRCDRGTLVDGEWVEIKVPSVTDPVNLDNGIKRVDWNGSSATIETADLVSALRTYKLTTTQEQRKAGKGQQLQITEQPDAPTVRTGSQMFDGLFALAMQEAKELTVTSIKNDAYNNNNLVPCGGNIGCYQTGDEWTYVWTRDTAYAVDLGLAQINPQVAKNSLLFKLSKRRDATQTLGPETTEIVQDTGSGGSWPVSTDRVVWARAAFELLKYLDGDDRTQFLNDAYTAIRNTIENDRLAAYDDRDGLYRGETSFLDWREQTYPDWMKDTVVHIAMSKTLSTNINHWKILDVAAKMAVELNKTSDAAKYAGWADGLKQQLKSDLWLKEAGLFSMMKTTELDQAPVRRYELLGEALAIQDGIADKAQTTSILQNYPHTAAGAPVVWLQMRGVKVYHNRAIWPFASSYLIKAAAKGQNSEVVNHSFDTLINGAALNLSNMENFEFTKLAVTADKAEDRPDIDSYKQLWSVGGYIGSVLDVVFGRDVNMTGIRFQPFITKKMHKTIFNGARQLQLKELVYRGKKITVKVNLPAVGTSNDGYYSISTAELNGAQIDLDRYTPSSDLKEGRVNVFVIGLIDNAADGGTARVVNPSQYYGPEPLNLDLTGSAWAAPTGADGLVNLSWTAKLPLYPTTINVYRNGALVASEITDSKWRDNDSNVSSQALCYSLEEQITTGLRNVSQRTNPACYWGNGRLTFIAADNATNNSVAGSHAQLKDDHGRRAWSDWGVPGEELTFAFTPSVSGSYHILLRYGNGFGPVNTGVTTAVKQMEITGASQAPSKGVVVMPHLPNWDTWGESTPATAKLTAGTSYKIKFGDFYNMSYLASNSTYSGSGGAGGISNRANITELILRRMAD
ncbi:alpha-L-rhamnosidase-related protein [Phyllobacterium sp. P5_D12]